MRTCVHFSRSLPSNSWWQTMVGCQVLSRPLAAEGGGRRPAFTGPATQPYSATEVGGWQQLSRVSQNRAAVQIHSNGNVSLGAGDAIQLRDLAGKKDPEGLITIDPVEPPEAMRDDPDLLFRDQTDWTVVNTAGRAAYRYNNREVLRAWAD